mgnify:CR=1 FL=1
MALIAQPRSTSTGAWSTSSGRGNDLRLPDLLPLLRGQAAKRCCGPLLPDAELPVAAWGGGVLKGETPMNIEDFINRGLAAQRAVDDLLTPCVCGHSKAEHDMAVQVEGFCSKYKARDA